MRIITFFNAKEKSEDRVYTLESNLGPNGNPRIWRKLMKTLRQKNKFTERLIRLIQEADEAKEKQNA